SLSRKNPSRRRRETSSCHYVDVGTVVAVGSSGYLGGVYRSGDIAFSQDGKLLIDDYVTVNFDVAFVVESWIASNTGITQLECVRRRSEISVECSSIDFTGDVAHVGNELPAAGVQIDLVAKKIASHYGEVRCTGIQRISHVDRTIESLHNATDIVDGNVLRLQRVDVDIASGSCKQATVCKVAGAGEKIQILRCRHRRVITYRPAGAHCQIPGAGDSPEVDDVVNGAE